MTKNTPPLRVAALVNLPRSLQAGGHVKCWERLAEAAAGSDLPLDLTVYFSNDAPDEILSPRVRFRHLPPVFSTERLKFLPYVPDHTDLVSCHRRLERELGQYDLIHTTDGFFAFAQTAARVSRRLKIPLVTSTHTDTVAYTRIFTRQTLETLFKRWPNLQRRLIEDWQLPDRQAAAMQGKLENHIRATTRTLVTRAEDHAMAEKILGAGRVHHLRLGIDKTMFGPHRRDRDGMLRDHAIPADRTVFLFVGRVDVGKNIYTLIAAMERLIAEGVPVHLLVAGRGPAMPDVAQRLGNHASLLGFVPPDDLAHLYASVDVLALCSEVEIRSMAGVEAMESHCPALVAASSGVVELFDHTPAMQPVASGAEAWAEAMRNFIANPNRQTVMRDAAASYSRTHLASWRDVLEKDLFAVWRAVATGA